MVPTGGVKFLGESEPQSSRAQAMNKQDSTDEGEECFYPTEHEDVDGTSKSQVAS